MPTTHRIDEKAGIIYLSATGATTEEEWTEARARVAADPLYRPGMNVLIDGLRHESLLTADFIRRIASGPIAGSGPDDQPRWAIVVSREAAYGLGRMFATLAKESHLLVRVFRDIHDAEEWLRDLSV
jgi:hypothetical protein